jgi:hypothetical protein
MPSFSLPLFDQPDPVPFQGRTAISRAASFSGAVHVAERGRGNQLARIRALWTVPRTMQEIADLTGIPINSMCSLKACLGAELEAVDRIRISWPGRRDTTRTRWRLKA